MSDNTVVVPNETVERLKADLRKVNPFEEGTLIRFKSVQAQTGQHYHYGAIFAGGQWWFTGQGNSFFPKNASHTQFLELLVNRGHLIVDLEVAVGFEKIEL